MSLTEVSSIRRVGGLDLLAWDVLAGADAYVTTRAGGVSRGPYESLNMGLAVHDDPAAVLENRRRVAAAIGAGLEDFVFSRQVHGRGVRIVAARDRGTGAFGYDESVPEADVLVTADPSVVLAILTADCTPVVLHDPVAGVLGAVHAGWRGTVARACAAAVEAMAGLGASPGSIVACLGPAIGADRYQVGDEVAEAATSAFGTQAGTVLKPDGMGRWLFDLVAANRLVLREAGLAAHNIHPTQFTTGGSGPGGPGGFPRGSTVSPVSRGREQNTVGDGTFFSDRSARPCGRLALVARLQSGGIAR
jgi:polyphenol oxidase